MKSLILLTLLMPVLTTAQQKKSYWQLHGGLSWSNEATTKGVVGFSAGARLGEAIGLGVGAGFIQFEKPYIPVTVDLSFLPTHRKFAPIAGVKAGYGFFNYHPSSTTTVRGGFVSTVFAGITLPGKNIRPNIMIGGTRYAFKSSYPTKTVGSDDKRLFAAVGLLF